jgi:hypothetical protein
MEALTIREEDFEESYYRPSGKRSGSKNALTGVMLLHKPTGIRVRCNRESSQGINRFIARRSLVEELEARRQNKTRHELKADKIRQDKLRRKGSRKRTQPMPNPFGMSKGELAYLTKEERENRPAPAPGIAPAPVPNPTPTPPRGISGAGDSGGSSGSGGFDLARAERAFILRMPTNGLPTMF